MAELLSQAEIDSLLSGIATSGVGMEDVLKEHEAKEKEAIPFDFRLPNRISKNQIRTLQTVHENFGEAFSSYLVTKLQTQVNIDVTSVDQLFYSEFVLSISNPSSLFVFKILESDGYGVLELNPQLVFGLVERLLGGSGDGGKKTRQVTQIEQNVVKGIVQRMFVDLQKAWHTITKLTFDLDRYESEADFVQITSASEIVLVVSIEITINNQQYLMNLCYPTFALEDVLSRLNAKHIANTVGTRKRDPATPIMLQRHVGRSETMVRAELGTASITVHDLIDLSVGDIIKLDQKNDSDCVVYVGGQRKYYASPGVYENGKAVKITRPYTENDKPSED